MNRRSEKMLGVHSCGPQASGCQKSETRLVQVTAGAFGSIELKVLSFGAIAEMQQLLEKRKTNE